MKHTRLFLAASLLVVGSLSIAQADNSHSHRFFGMLFAADDAGASNERRGRRDRGQRRSRGRGRGARHRYKWRWGGFMNQSPTASSDTYTVQQNSTGNTFEILNNDTGRDLSIAYLYDSTQQGGQISQEDDTVSYQAPVGFSGMDEFWYIAVDDAGRTTAAQVTVNVEGTTTITDVAETTAADLTGTDLTGTDFTATDPTATDTTTTDPTATDTTAADIAAANVAAANLAGANIIATDLTATDLTATTPADTDLANNDLTATATDTTVTNTVDITTATSEITDITGIVTNSVSTASVECDYADSTFNETASVNATSNSTWTCADGVRTLAANGLPDHPVGEFPNDTNPNAIAEQTVSANLPLTPTQTDTATPLGGPAGVIGYVLNGIKIDAGTNGACDDSGENCDTASVIGPWSIEALGQDSFAFGIDGSNGHVQPDGSYHYHGMPEGFLVKQGASDAVMTLIGWAADGFPIYARYGYNDPQDRDSGIKAMTGSYELVGTPGENRPSVDTFPLGTFSQDWEYIAGSGDLDECNGRQGVTPDFPEGIYHYYATDTYPYFQRCVKGEVEGDISAQVPVLPEIENTLETQLPLPE